MPRAGHRPRTSWVRWFYSDWRSDPKTLELSAVSRCLYFEALMFMAANGGKMPDERSKLAARLRVTELELEQGWEPARELLFLDNDGNLFHPKLTEEIERATESSERARENAAKRGKNEGPGTTVPPVVPSLVPPDGVTNQNQNQNQKKKNQKRDKNLPSGGVRPSEPDESPPPEAAMTVSPPREVSISRMAEGYQGFGEAVQTREGFAPASGPACVWEFMDRAWTAVRGSQIEPFRGGKAAKLAKTLAENSRGNPQELLRRMSNMMASDFHCRHASPEYLVRHWNKLDKDEREARDIAATMRTAISETRLAEKPSEGRFW